MSEFSESYHFRSENAGDVVSLLKRAGLKGYVFPPQNGWVSFVAAENAFSPDQRIVEKNTGTLLHFVSAEDHGWSFALFDGSELKSAYDCGWEDDVRVDDSRYSPEAFSRLIGPAGADAVASFEGILRPADLDAAIESQPSTVFGTALRLPKYEWFAYDYVAHDYHERPSEYLGVAKVT